MYADRNRQGPPEDTRHSRGTFYIEAVWTMRGWSVRLEDSDPTVEDSWLGPPTTGAGITTDLCGSVEVTVTADGELVDLEVGDAILSGEGAAPIYAKIAGCTIAEAMKAISAASEQIVYELAFKMFEEGMIDYTHCDEVLT